MERVLAPEFKSELELLSGQVEMAKESLDKVLHRG